MDVSLPVPSEFLLPKFRVAFWAACITAPATVPETSVNKYGQPVPNKNKVRLSNEKIISAPSRDPKTLHEPNELQFRSEVTVRSDSGHERRALLFRKKINHEITIVRCDQTEENAGKILCSYEFFLAKFLGFHPLETRVCLESAGDSRNRVVIID